MEMKKAILARLLVGSLLASLLTACAAAGMRQALITDVYVADFKSEDIQSCRSSDVPLNHARARDFFRRARQVNYTVIHDHYDVSPCYIEGTLKYHTNTCEWKIRAGATG
jgi:hypothetical protein